MKFQFCDRRVQWSSSVWSIFSSGYWRNQRWPPCSRGRASQVTATACRRPPGSSTRYCCSGATPNVYLTSKSASCAVGSVGADEVLAVAPEEPGLDALEAVGRVVEIAQHRLSGGVLHGDGMLRGLPGLRFGRVALRAGLRADVCGGCGDCLASCRRRGLAWLAPGEEIPGSQGQHRNARKRADPQRSRPVRSICRDHQAQVRD